MSVPKTAVAALLVLSFSLVPSVASAHLFFNRPLLAVYPLDPKQVGTTLDWNGIPSAEMHPDAGVLVRAFAYQGTDYTYIEFHVINESDEAFMFDTNQIYFTDSSNYVNRAVPTPNVAAVIASQLSQQQRARLAPPPPPPRQQTRTITTGNVDSNGNVSLQSRTVPDRNAQAEEAGAGLGALLNKFFNRKADAAAANAEAVAAEFVSRLYRQPFESANIPPHTNMAFTACIRHNRDGQYRMTYRSGGLGSFQFF